MVKAPVDEGTCLQMIRSYNQSPNKANLPTECKQYVQNIRRMLTKTTEIQVNPEIKAELKRRNTLTNCFEKQMVRLNLEMLESYHENEELEWQCMIIDVLESDYILKNDSTMEQRFKLRCAEIPGLSFYAQQHAAIHQGMKRKTSDVVYNDIMVYVSDEKLSSIANAVKVNDMVALRGSVVLSTLESPTAFQCTEMKRWSREEIGGSGEIDSVLDMRKKVVEYLKGIVHGDEVAAEYLLLNICSTVLEHQAENGPRLGVCPINVMVQKDFCVQKFTNALKMIVPMCTTIPVSIRHLNDASMKVKKNYDTNRIGKGELQLPPGTVMVLDETRLEEGRLTERGVENVKVLKKAVFQQLLEYDFEYYNIDFPLNICPIAISNTKSILQFPMTIPIQTSVMLTEQSSMDDGLHAMRKYLNYVRKVPYKLDNDTEIERIESWFVEKRKQDASITADHLHQSLSLARVISMSFGASHINETLWNHMIQLESKRIDRLKQHP